MKEAWGMPDDLNAMVAELAHDEVGFFVEGKADGMVERAVAAGESARRREIGA